MKNKFILVFLFLVAYIFVVIKYGVNIYLDLAIAVISIIPLYFKKYKGYIFSFHIRILFLILLLVLGVVEIILYLSIFPGSIGVIVSYISYFINTFKIKNSNT